MSAAAGGAVCDAVPAVVRPGVPGVQLRGVQHHHQGEQGQAWLSYIFVCGYGYYVWLGGYLIKNFK